MTLALLALAAAIWLARDERPGRAVCHRRPRDPRPADELSWLPLVLDLTAAGLAAGLPIEAALSAAAPVHLPWLGSRLRQVAGLLRLGADPAEAWSALESEPRLRALAITAVRSASSGIRLAANLGELATQVRADTRAAALARVQRAGVWVIVPLGLCFLPAFVCIGIVPVVIGIAGSLSR